MNVHEDQMTRNTGREQSPWLNQNISGSFYAQRLRTLVTYVSVCKLILEVKDEAVQL